MAFRRWEYGLEGSSHAEFALFDAIERELRAILDFADVSDCDFEG